MSKKIVFVFIFIVLSSFVFAQNYVQLGSDSGNGYPYVKLGTETLLSGNNITNVYNNITNNFINETANYTLINETIDIKINNYNSSWWGYIIGLIDDLFLLGHSHDQDLNTTSNVTFNYINNMSINTNGSLIDFYVDVYEQDTNESCIEINGITTCFGDICLSNGTTVDGTECTGDNLGSHAATQNLSMSGFNINNVTKIINRNETRGIYICTSGTIIIGNTSLSSEVC